MTDEDPSITLQKNFVKAMEDSNKTLFLQTLEFTRAAGYEEAALNMVNGALMLALWKPRVELLDWLDEAKILFTIKELEENVSKVPHKEVLEWFAKKRVNDKTNAVPKRIYEKAARAASETNPVNDNNVTNLKDEYVEFLKKDMQKMGESANKKDTPAPPKKRK